MAHNSFASKWQGIHTKPDSVAVDETSLYVPKGAAPITQRQLNLYNYFLFIQERLEKIGARDVLEIGCGRGTIALYLASYLGMNLSLLDDNADAIEIAKKGFADLDLQAQFYVDDALKPQLPDESFDVIVSIGLAEHLDDVDSLFAHQYRMLRPGGVMVTLNIPKKFSVQSLNTVLRSIKKLFGTYKESVRKDYYRNTHKPAAYKAFAEKVGFKDIELMNVCPFPVYVPMSMKMDKRVTSFRKFILKMRKLFMRYPYKTNYTMSQAHFLVGYKPKHN